MVITIKGKQGEGKTTLAETMTKGKKVLFINECRLWEFDWLLSLDEDTEFLVIDEIASMKKVKKLLAKKRFNVRRLYSYKCMWVKLPQNIILIKQRPPKGLLF